MGEDLERVPDSLTRDRYELRSERGWNLNYAEAMNGWLRSERRAHRERSPGVHVSDLASENGLECPRVPYFGLVNAPRQGHAPSPQLQDTYDIGHAIHEMTYPRLERALQEAYPWLEFQCYREHNLVIEEVALTGTRDFVVYARGVDGKGRTHKALLDVKSTSVTASNDRIDTKTQAVTVEPEYIRQLTLYAGMEAALTGQPFDQVDILYVVKEQRQPMHVYQTPIRLIDRYYERQVNRLRGIIDTINDGRSPNPSWRPTKCDKCPYVQVCQQLPPGEPWEQ